MPALLLRLDAEPPGGPAWRRALALLRNDGVLACPTETFYGLAADALSARAVGRVFEIKGREFRKPLPLLIGNAGQLPPLVRHVPPVARALMEAFWPGPLTLVLKAAGHLPDELVGPERTIGVRLPNLAWLRELVRSAGFPVVATSANLSGGKEIDSGEAAVRQFKDKADLIVDGGKTTGGSPSTVVDLITDRPVIRREGAIPRPVLERAVGALRPLI